MDDNDLKGHFEGIDGRFAEVDVRFDKIDARFAEVDARFDKVDARFAEVDARFDKVDARFAEVDAHFDKVDVRFSEMRQLILDEGKRTRRHFEVVAEGLKDDIKVIAEGHATLIAHNAVADGRFHRLEEEQTRIEVRVTAVESRVGSVDKAQKIVRRPRRKHP